MGSVSDARPLPEAARGLSVGFANLWRMVSPGSGRSMVHYGQATTGGPRKRSIRRRMQANRARGTATSASWNTA
jgi:hypothetical protein